MHSTMKRTPVLYKGQFLTGISPRQKMYSGRRGQLRCYARRNAGSELITQEILLFCYQQDLEGTLVRALNTDNQELAQYMRERLQAIDSIVQEIQAIKAAATGAAEVPTTGPSDFADSFRLRSSLQEAIMAERYEEAAALRDELRVLQEKLDAASGHADAASQKLKQERQLRLGQRVVHSTEGYRGIICGWDGSCSETEEWQESAGIDKLRHGADQPFYQLLVDLRDAAKVGPREAGLVAYVPQELLETLQGDDSWTQEFGGDGFTNPFKFKLFLGKDERGDFLPARPLREKYSQERRDVFPEDDEDDEDSEDSETKSSSQGSATGRIAGVSSSDADLLDRLFVQSDDDTPEDGRPSSK